MKTLITIEITHDKPVPHLADMVAGRAWTIGGVTKAEVADARPSDAVDNLFTPEELALGRMDVVRT